MGGGGGGGEIGSHINLVVSSASLSRINRSPGTKFNEEWRDSKQCREPPNYYLSNGDLWLDNNAGEIESAVQVKCRNQFCCILQIL